MSMEIIIVDDDDIVLFLHEVYLKESFVNLPLKTFNNAESAIDYLQQNAHFYNDYLVLIDINMPKMSGWDFMDAVQKEPFYHKLHIVMATSSIDIKDKHKAESYSRMIDFCQKPITDDLCLKLRELPSIKELL